MYKVVRMFSFYIIEFIPAALRYTIIITNCFQCDIIPVTGQPRDCKSLCSSAANVCIFISVVSNRLVICIFYFNNITVICPLECNIICRDVNAVFIIMIVLHQSRSDLFGSAYSKISQPFDRSRSQLDILTGQAKSLRILLSFNRSSGILTIIDGCSHIDIQPESASGFLQFVPADEGDRCF